MSKKKKFYLDVYTHNGCVLIHLSRDTWPTVLKTENRLFFMTSDHDDRDGGLFEYIAAGNSFYLFMFFFSVGVLMGQKANVSHRESMVDNGIF